MEICPSKAAPQTSTADRSATNVSKSVALTLSSTRSWPMTPDTPSSTGRRSRPPARSCGRPKPRFNRPSTLGQPLSSTSSTASRRARSTFFGRAVVIGDDTPGGDAPVLEGAGLPCPQCGAEHGGKLAQRRSRFGYFLGCDRYPECRFIPKPEVPEEFRLTFDAPCPVCGSEHGGKLQPKRNSKRNTYFYSCDRYPECKTIRPRPTGATHGDCGAVIGRDDDGGICCRCGARIDLPDGELLGAVLAGGTADPLAFAPKRGRRAAADGSTATSRGRGKVASRSTGASSRRRLKRVPAAAAIAADSTETSAVGGEGEGT